MADLKENQMMQTSASLLRCLDSNGNSGVIPLNLAIGKTNYAKEVNVENSPWEIEVPLFALVLITYYYNSTSGLFFKDTGNSIFALKNSLPSAVQVSANGNFLSISSSKGRYGLNVFIFNIS